jgi:hypothetical protein
MGVLEFYYKMNSVSNIMRSSQNSQKSASMSCNSMYLESCGVAGISCHQNTDFGLNCNSSSVETPCGIQNSVSPFSFDSVPSPNRQASKVDCVEVNDFNDELGIAESKESVLPFASLYNETVVENEYVRDEMIDVGSKILTQIACTNLSYSTYLPSLDIKPALFQTHSCPVCESHSELISLSQYFLKSGMSDLNGIEVCLRIFYRFLYVERATRYREQHMWECYSGSTTVDGNTFG